MYRAATPRHPPDTPRRGTLAHVDDALAPFRQCPRCLYHRRGLPTDAACPECGEPGGVDRLAIIGVAYNDSGPVWPVLVSGLLVLAGLLSWLTPTPTRLGLVVHFLTGAAGIAGGVLLFLKRDRLSHARSSSDWHHNRERVIIEPDAVTVLRKHIRPRVPWSEGARVEIHQRDASTLSPWRRSQVRHWLILRQARRGSIFHPVTWWGPRLNVWMMLHADDAEAAALLAFIRRCQTHLTHSASIEADPS